MTGQEFLDQIEHLETMIINKKAEKKMWEDIAKGITPNYDGERVQSTGNQQKMSDAVNMIVEISREIDRITKELIKKLDEIIKTIEKLNAKEYNVLHLIYIQKMVIKEAAAACRKSPSWVKNVHSDAVKHLGWIINKK